MSGNITNAHENALLDYSLPDDGVYLALLSAAGSDSAAGTELSGSGYARKPISMAAAASGVKSNDTEILFDAATGSDWAEIQAYAIYDNVSGGNRIWHFTLASPDRRTVHVGDQYRVAIGDLSFSLD